MYICRFMAALSIFSAQSLLQADSCFQRLRARYESEPPMVRQSVFGNKFYFVVPGLENKARMGDVTFVQQYSEALQLEFSADEVNLVRSHSPLGEHLMALKRKVPASIWNDSFSLSLHLPYMMWAKHNVFQVLPKFVRDEVVGRIEASQEGYKEKVKAIARDGSLSPEQRVEKLRKNSEDWVREIGFPDYVKFARDSLEARKKLYADFDYENDLPSGLDPELDGQWFVDFIHPLNKEGNPVEHKWLINTLAQLPIDERTEIIYFFRENPKRALDFSHIMSELGQVAGDAVLETGNALDFFVRVDRMNHASRTAIIETLVSEGVNGKHNMDRIISAIKTAPYETVYRLYKAVANNKISREDAEMFILSPYFEKHGFPKILTEEEVPTMIRAVLGYSSEPDVLAWARMRGKDYSEQSPGLKRMFDHIANKDNQTMDVVVDAKHAASILWYPRYPGGHYSWTHTKIVVDGEVYGTMGIIEKFKSINVHDRKARANLKDGYFKFDIEVTTKELENLKHLVSTGQRIAVENHWGCVHGTCGTFAAATSLQIPAPFNQLPSATAIYLAARKAFGDQKVKSIEFVGRNKFLSLMSPDIARDAYEVLSQPPVAGTGFVLAIIGGTVYVVSNMQDEIEERKKEEAELLESERRRAAERGN